MEENRPRWGARTSNPGGAASLSRVGSTPTLFRQLRLERLASNLRNRFALPPVCLVNGSLFALECDPCHTLSARKGVTLHVSRPREKSVVARMNAKILGTIVFVLIPGLALAQTAGETLASVDKSGAQVSQREPWLGSGANGSDGNGCVTPSGGESDANATTAPSSKPPIAFRGDVPM
jgi:hypothetical protein